MIHSLRLQNFKPFEEQSLEFRPLTLLSGLNSTGKSSVLQALMLLRQSYLRGLLPETGLALNGELVCIGTGKDALFEGAKEKSISFDIVWADGEKGSWRFHYNPEAEELSLASTPAPSEVYKASLFGDNFQYLQAERGFRAYLEMSDFQVLEHRQLGARGEYTAHFLSNFGNQDIPNCRLSHPWAQSMSLQNQVEAWMGEVSPGTKIHLTENLTGGQVNLQYSYGLSNKYRATNVGFGISYTLPIVVAVLAAKPGTLLLIENPEAHLHPKGQSQMGRLLALAASCGVQVVIETHSDHVLNGICLAVHGGKLEPENVQLHFFRRQEQNGQAMSEVVSPRIDRDGRIDRWPDGFFDQAEKDLMVLI